MRTGRCLSWIALWAALVTTPVSAASQAPERTLFILLDAVPHSLMEELTDPQRPGGPLFPGFSRPVPFVSSFPSSTSVAAAGIFEPAGLEPSPGYEARFFDWQKRRVRGGGPVSYFRIDFPWRDFFDWSRKGAVRSAFAALRPVNASSQRVKTAVEAFFDSGSSTFFVYLETTDTAAHLKGPAALEPVFVALDRALRAARRRHGDLEYRVVLFSDHGIAGGEPLRNVWGPVRRRLRQSGYRFRRRLERPGDVVLTPFGLVSSLEVYTDPETSLPVAAALARVEGVDLCVLPTGDGWRVEASEGSAEFRRWRGPDGEVEWEYRPQSGDPLGYQPVVERLRRDLGDPARSRFPDARWFAENGREWYPDALHRIARAFDLVENPASILCSLEPQYMYGLEKTEFLARLSQGRLRWTHGALHRPASDGFLMTDDPGWRPPEVVRFDRGLAPFLPATGNGVR